MTIFGIHPLNNLLHICDVLTLDPKSVPTFNLSGTLCGKFNHATEFIEICIHVILDLGTICQLE